MYSSTDGDEGVPLVIRDSKQWRAVVEVGPVRPGKDCSSPLDFVTVPEPIEYSVGGVPNEVGSSYVDSVVVPVPIDHLGVWGTADTSSTGQPMKHSDTSGYRENGRQNHAGDGNSPRDVRTEDQRFSPDDEDAIVVGAVVEIELMIDTGCQVTILATSVFERMCTTDPRVRSRLRPCGQWLV